MKNTPVQWKSWPFVLQPAAWAKSLCMWGGRGGSKLFHLLALIGVRRD